VLTVCAAFPLLLLGAGVTSIQSGMVDDHGLRVPWHLFIVENLRERGLGFLIEHSHRTAGWIVGTCIIVLAGSLWWMEARRWLRWLGTAALAAVIIQGMLGRYRVDLNALLGPKLALIHGLFAQLVFALLVSVALFTSRGWLRQTGGRIRPTQVTALRRLALFVPLAVYAQMIFGAFVRHTDLVAGPRLHLLFAFVVVAAVAWLMKSVGNMPAGDRGLIRSVRWLVVLVGLQLWLGVESWLAKFPPSPLWPQLQPLGAQPELVRSLHYVIGSVLFATAVVTALRAFWLTAAGPDRPAEKNGAAGLHGEAIWSSSSRLGDLEGRA
jgi:heme A synthase